MFGLYFLITTVNIYLFSDLFVEILQYTVINGVVPFINNFYNHRNINKVITISIDTIKNETNSDTTTEIESDDSDYENEESETDDNNFDDTILVEIVE